ncbi:MAG: carbon storage regulator CsrA [Planctomycetes bacterium]|nr:carbon storage regulator CsrA [Planctomycetota bacterium]
MLVLTRKVNESIIIADHIEIKIAQIVGHKVRLAIDAPKDIPVHRKEIFLAIQAEKQKAEPV